MNDPIDRQTAIDICNNAIDLWHGQLGEGIVIAVKKKIEELPSAQPETHEERTETHACDSISRQAAIDALQKHFNPTGAELSPDLASVLAGVGVVINTMPSAQPQRTGHWIEDDDEMFVICSECGEKNDYISAYCPDCGARMEGE